MRNITPNQNFPLSLIGVAIALLFFIVLNAFVIINPGQAGVLSVLGKAQDGALLEGIHFKPPLIASVDVYDVTVQKFEVPAQSSTKDLQDLTARFAINFRLDPVKVVEIRRTQGTLQNIVSKIIAPKPKNPLRLPPPSAPSKKRSPNAPNLRMTLIPPSKPASKNMASLSSTPASLI